MVLLAPPHLLQALAPPQLPPLAPPQMHGQLDQMANQSLPDLMASHGLWVKMASQSPQGLMADTDGRAISGLEVLI